MKLTYKVSVVKAHDKVENLEGVLKEDMMRRLTSFSPPFKSTRVIGKEFEKGNGSNFDTSFERRKSKTENYFPFLFKVRE